MTTPTPLIYFHLKQRITMGVKRYQFGESDEMGAEGRIFAMAQQKRFKLKDEVVFFADEARTQRVFSYKARNVLDLAGTTDVFDENGLPIGSFRKDFKASLLNSTWYVAPGQHGEFRGSERSALVAALRRFTDITFIPYHFDFVGPEGGAGFSVDKRWGIRDKYVIAVYDQRLDWRVVAAMTVALDAMQGR